MLVYTFEMVYTQQKLVSNYTVILTGRDVMQSHPLRRTRFGQYQASWGCIHVTIHDMGQNSGCIHVAIPDKRRNSGYIHITTRRAIFM